MGYDTLQGQITQFSIQSASCYSQSDRELVDETIKLWFKDLETFNGFVRTNVANKIMAAIPQPNWFPLRLSCCIMAPVFFFGLDWSIYYVHLHEDASDQAIAGVIQLFQYPIQLEILQTLAIQLANRQCIKKRRCGSGRCRELLVSFGVGEALAMLMAGIYEFAGRVRMMGSVAMAIYVVVILGIALILRCIGARRSNV